MSDVTLVLLGAGNSTRFGLPVKKQWLWIEDKPLWLFVLERFTKLLTVKETIITCTKEERPFFEKYCDARIIEGGATRQASIQNALEHIDTPLVLISDIARACVQEEVLARLFAYDDFDCVAPAITPADTVVYRNETIDRSAVKLVQTPQLSKTATLKEALRIGEFTDESSAIQAIGGKVIYIQGDRRQHKLTFAEDLKLLECLKPPNKTVRVGSGFDVHPFSDQKELWLCGVRIDYPYGLAGHSDADVALHALIDALLGAAGFGDIGELFPDSDQTYKGIDSKILLQKTKRLLNWCGFVIANIDLTIIAQEPKLAPYKPKMLQTLSDILELPKHLINLKATTTEKLGFIGRKEGVAAQAVANLHYFDWSRQ